MDEPPTIRGFQFQEESVASEIDLAARFGEPLWVPAEWPASHNPPEFLVLRPPPGESEDDNVRPSYQLRSVTDGTLLVVHGSRRRPGNLESGLILLQGERFETWSRPEDRESHIVVRAPVWDPVT